MLFERALENVTHTKHLEMWTSWHFQRKDLNTMTTIHIGEPVEGSSMACGGDSEHRESRKWWEWRQRLEKVLRNCPTSGRSPHVSKGSTTMRNDSSYIGLFVYVVTAQAILKLLADPCISLSVCWVWDAEHALSFPAQYQICDPLTRTSTPIQQICENFMQQHWETYTCLWFCVLF
jgi:hypothetical protein